VRGPSFTSRSAPYETFAPKGRRDVWRCEAAGQTHGSALGRFEVGRFSRIGGFQVVGAAGPLPGIILKNEAANMSRTSLLSDQSR
jgi:hypothetical protein